MATEYATNDTENTGQHDQRQVSSEQDKARLCTDMIDSHIKQIHMQAKPLDCMELHIGDSAKCVFY